MKLVVFGLSISSAWGNGHATLWRGLCRALAVHGHRVVFFERNTPFYAAHRDYTRIPGGELVLYEDWNAVRSRAAASIQDADAAFVTSYCPDAIVATELVLNAKRALRCFYDLDSPVTLARLAAGETVEYLGSGGLREFDLVLSYAGGAAISGLEEQLGARLVLPLYGSVDPELHRLAHAEEHYRANFSYLGTYAADRQPALEELFLRPARELRENRFLIGGSMYPQSFPWAENIYFVKHVPPGDHPAFYSSCEFTLNVTRASMAATGYCPSARLFEAAACGTPLITDSWKGLELFFEPGEEIVVARDCRDVVDGLEMSATERKRLAKRARERVLEFHTAEERALELINHLETARATAGGNMAEKEPSICGE